VGELHGKGSLGCGRKLTDLVSYLAEMVKIQLKLRYIHLQRKDNPFMGEIGKAKISLEKHQD
jgi:hypothetical protein